MIRASEAQERAGAAGPELGLCAAGPSVVAALHPVPGQRADGLLLGPPGTRRSVGRGSPGVIFLCSLLGRGLAVLHIII